MNRCLSHLLCAVALAACSTDVCHQADNVAQLQTNALIGCKQSTDYDGGAEVAVCEAAFPQCSGANQSALGDVVSCLQKLPATQCTWFTESSAMKIADTSYLDYVADVANCENLLTDAGITASCQASLPIGPTGVEVTSGNVNWGGSYTVASGMFTQGTENVAAPAGTETLSQNGSNVTWNSFASPSIPSCTLMLQASGSVVDFTGNSCGQFKIQTGSANFIPGSPPQIAVSGQGTSIDAGDFMFNFQLTSQ